jgi:hypothetical protein
MSLIYIFNHKTKEVKVIRLFFVGLRVTDTWLDIQALTGYQPIPEISKPMLN